MLRPSPRVGRIKIGPQNHGKTFGAHLAAPLLNCVLGLLDRGAESNRPLGTSPEFRARESVRVECLSLPHYAQESKANYRNKAK